MLKLLLERRSRTLRANEQFEVEVKDLKEAVRVKYMHMSSFGASEIQFAETGRVTFEDGTTNYIGFNGRIWDDKYWVSSPGKCYNVNAKEVFA
jgi:hypothetical protein